MIHHWWISIVEHKTLLESSFIILLYVLAVITGFKVITQTTQPAKALGYLMLLFFLPGIGLLIYFAIGENRRVNKIYDRKLFHDLRRYDKVKERIIKESWENYASNEAALSQHHNVIQLLLKDTLSPLTIHNKVRLLINGENKFPELIAALKAATHHIHMEYYIYENGVIGDEIRAILMEKARQGVAVRFVYDDFGSKDIKPRWLKKLRSSGVEAFPFYRVRFFANRLNYRNHRKIVIVDGSVAYVGGINVSDKYCNDIPNKVFWRDTHLEIKGGGVYSLQYLFLSDWSFASGQDVDFHESFFPPNDVPGKTLVQIASSGPDSLNPTIMMATDSVILNARDYVYITTPYFIPNESVYDAIRIAALGGLDVRMLVPYHSDSWVVNKAASAYYEELLDSGVKIYRYKKGFVHAKTMVADDLAMVGSANMDNRSFELNFETNALVYDKQVASDLKAQFLLDIADGELLDAERWKRRSKATRLAESFARLLSGVL
jgi:cardiolipin synthase